LKNKNITKTNLNREEQKLFSSRNPAEYISNSLKSRLQPGRKAYITKMWLRMKGYGIVEIQHARNIHPYWKSRKMAGSVERNLKRRKNHDYSSHRRLDWTDDTIKEFIMMNGKNKDGRYIHKDYELARHFGSTIPAIQHYRRKYNMAVAIIEKRDCERPSRNRIFNYITKCEQALRKLIA
jgi:hypothetical protein